MSVEVDEIVLFTRILDGGTFRRCSCGFIWRRPGGLTESCRACGLPDTHSVESTEQEYRLSRKS